MDCKGAWLEPLFLNSVLKLLALVCSLYVIVCAENSKRDQASAKVIVDVDSKNRCKRRPGYPVIIASGDNTNNIEQELNWFK